jgi:uncharacterized protein
MRAASRPRHCGWAMRVTVQSGLESVDPADWNRLAGDNPFLRYEFLAALERRGCVGGTTGWEPCHITLQAEPSEGGELLGAVPLYIKHHSYGEYVFDWSWAEAYERSGHAYYPKLVAAVPFTPATGPRLLLARNTATPAVAAQLIEAAREAAKAHEVSSLHWLFHDAAETDLLRGHGFLQRVACQFHWSNPGYRDFADFLDAFTSHKRNNIRRERRRVREAGVSMEVLPGNSITPELWDVFYRFYRATIRAHGGMPYLTREFFQTLGSTMPENVALTVARRGGEYVAAALALRNAHTLYGRYWGGRADIPDLHFETCYYTPIEYCIAEGIARYEAGAQGEHKLARGFAPVQTYSAHWLRDAGFRRAVADFLRREQDHVGYYINELNEHSPFRAPGIPFHG